MTIPHTYHSMTQTPVWYVMAKWRKGQILPFNFLGSYRYYQFCASYHYQNWSLKYNQFGCLDFLNISMGITCSLTEAMFENSSILHSRFASQKITCTSQHFKNFWPSMFRELKWQTFSNWHLPIHSRWFTNKLVPLLHHVHYRVPMHNRHQMTQWTFAKSLVDEERSTFQSSATSAELFQTFLFVIWKGLWSYKYNITITKYLVQSDYGPSNDSKNKCLCDSYRIWDNKTKQSKKHTPSQKR